MIFHLLELYYICVQARTNFAGRMSLKKISLCFYEVKHDLFFAMFGFQGLKIVLPNNGLIGSNDFSVLEDIENIEVRNKAIDEKDNIFIFPYDSLISDPVQLFC